MRRSLYCLCLLILASVSTAREVSKHFPQSASAAGPAYCTATHDVGRVGMLISNGGILGVTPPWVSDSGGCHLGSLRLEPYRHADEYPLGYGVSTLGKGSIWIGGINELGDTLVSTGYSIIKGPFDYDINLELHPHAAPDGEIEMHSINDARDVKVARSEQDYVTHYSDTCLRNVPGLLPDFLSLKQHTPLGLDIIQTSMAWSGSLVNDFILIEYKIANVGPWNLRECWVGQHLSPALDTKYGFAGSDEVCGFLRNVVSTAGCGFEDTLDMAWAADSDGDPSQGEWVTAGPNRSHFEVAGMRVLERPSEHNTISYNWWISPEWAMYWGAESDYGPRLRPPSGVKPRNFRTGGTGYPEGDANKYYVMSNGEIDFDSPFLNVIEPNDPT